MKNSLSTLSILLLNVLCSYGIIAQNQHAFTITIPMAGNSWVMDASGFIASPTITTDGVRNWQNSNETIRTFFYVQQPGTISIGIRSRVPGNSQIAVSFGYETELKVLSERQFTDVPIGVFQVETRGYHFVDLKGIHKEGTTYGDISALLLNAENPDTIKYIKAEEAITKDFHFERRGPSDHLNFEIPTGVDNIEWFYSELIVPQGQDVEGSYFMANGFAEGYFGIQVNSPTERRVLFSVWSPYKTDDPSSIPEDFKITLLKKGEDVITGKFGNEGSGGQSYKLYNWNANTRYGFLVGAKPSINNSTDYTAYFYDPERNDWALIAQFRRPKTTTYLKGLYSFLENFKPNQGVFERRCLYQNQWAYNESGWHEVNKATFTADVTARKEYRFDFSGGIEGDGFYLKNCGFTNNHTPMQSKFEREKLNRLPNVDFQNLD